MATFRAIAAVSRAIVRLLEDACPRNEFPDAHFDLQQAMDFAKPIVPEGVTVFLYRVGVNGSRRNPPPRLLPDGRRLRPPIPLDLYYAICAWGRTADVQQQLLGFAVRTLDDTPILPAGLLNDFLPQRTTFQPQDTVELVCDPVSMQDLDSLWDVLKPNVPLVITYTARMVPIESEISLIEAPAVQTRAFDLGVVGETT